MNRQRRDRVRRQTIEYLGYLLHDHPGVDGGLYTNPDGSALADDEAGYARKIAGQEGERLIARARRR